MSPESAGGSKFSQLMTDHILGYIYRNVLAAVVNRKGVSYEIREDG